MTNLSNQWMEYGAQHQHGRDGEAQGTKSPTICGCCAGVDLGNSPLIHGKESLVFF